jgi:hypothetical protein
MTNPVTRHLSLTSEIFSPNCYNFPTVDQLFPLPKFTPVYDTKHENWYPVKPTKVQLVGFCDWVSMYQRHGAGLPKLCDGAFMRIDREGEIVNTTLKKLKIEGSHETAIFIRCDGETVWFEGNVSKYERLDNVFGYSFRQCFLRINNILHSLGLPAFTEGEKFMTNVKGEPRSVWTGASVTRVDVTENFSTGSKEDAFSFMRFLAAQQASRLKTGTYGEGETVDWGRGSRVVYSKAYLKAPELRRHNKSLDPYLVMLSDWCDSVGLVRFETTYKSTFLHKHGLNYLGGFDMRQIECDFEERRGILSRCSAEVDDLSSLPKALLSTLRMWQAGDDIVSKLSRPTFYRHRRGLLAVGVDIAIKSNVTQLKTRTKVITLGLLTAPDFYQLPEIERVRNVVNYR